MCSKKAIQIEECDSKLKIIRFNLAHLEVTLNNTFWRGVRAVKALKELNLFEWNITTGHHSSSSFFGSYALISTTYLLITKE